VIENEVADLKARLAAGHLPPLARNADERRLRQLEAYLGDFPTGPGAG
jgi:hypothetical protein